MKRLTASATSNVNHISKTDSTGNLKQFQRVEENSLDKKVKIKNNYLRFLLKRFYAPLVIEKSNRGE
jgi:hypothetical protein